MAVDEAVWTHFLNLGLLTVAPAATLMAPALTVVSTLSGMEE